MSQFKEEEPNKAMPKGAKATSIDSSKTVTHSYPGGMKIDQGSGGQTITYPDGREEKPDSSTIMTHSYAGGLNIQGSGGQSINLPGGIWTFVHHGSGGLTITHPDGREVHHGSEVQTIKLPGGIEVHQGSGRLVTIKLQDDSKVHQGSGG